MKRYFGLICLFVISILLQPSLQAQEVKKERFYIIGAGHFADEVVKLEALLHRWGVDNNKEKIPNLIDAVKNAKEFETVVIAMHALARMGAEEALPEVDKVLEDTKKRLSSHPYLVIAELCHARLVAEIKSKEGTAEEKAEKKLNTFLEEMKLTIEEINEKSGQRVKGSFFATREAYILREIADMIYQTKDTALTQLAKDRNLKFTNEKYADIKMQLCPKTQRERITWILDHLSKVEAVTQDSYCAVQLAIDEGVPASNAAVDKLKEMSKNREIYEKKVGDQSYFPGFYAVMLVIKGVGDKQPYSFMKELAQDAQPDIADGALKTLAYTAKGVGRVLDIIF